MNKYKDTLIILAEDEALHAVVNGYLIHASVNQRACHLEKYERGWVHVKERIPDYKKELKRYTSLRVLFVIDFDDNESRLQEFRDEFGDELQDRMFVLGPKSNVEKLKKCLEASSFEDVGKQLAEGCPIVKTEENPWYCEQLGHIFSEITSLQQKVYPFLHNTNTAIS